MKVKQIGAFLLAYSILNHSPAVAQKQVAAPTNRDEVITQLYSSCKNYLQCATQIATGRAAFWKGEIARMSQLESGFKVCEFDRASFLYKYYNWFEKYRSQLAEMDRRFLDIDEQIRTRVDQIQNVTVDVLAVEGQDKSTYPIVFKQVVGYLKNLNGRIKEQKPEQIPALLRVQENYMANPLQVAHSQVIAAIEKTNTTLNASLKEQKSAFSVSLVQKDSLFDYVLKYEATLLDQPIKIEVSLFARPTNAGYGMSETEKWKAITASRQVVGGYPIDGQARYRKMQEKIREKTCKTENWDQVSFSMLSLPLVTEKTFITGGVLQPNQLTLDEFCETDAATFLSRLYAMEEYKLLEVIDDHGTTILGFKRSSYYTRAYFQNQEYQKVKPADYSAKQVNELKAKMNCGQ